MRPGEKRLRARHARPAEAIGERHAEDHLHRRPDRHQPDTDDQRAHNDTAAQDRAIRLQRGILREEDQPTTDDILGAGEADRDDVDHREEHDEGDQDQENRLQYLHERASLFHPDRAVPTAAPEQTAALGAMCGDNGGEGGGLVPLGHLGRVRDRH